MQIILFSWLTLTVCGLLGGIRNGLSNALNTTLSFANGAARAVTDNILLGSTSLRETGNI